ncbi:alpha/beta-hydrolase [Meira miltonrushii]|uniref:Alpha/beta-hydrolase n=1 Tax=Meira miltonrushii TaxID=1280837 RepID=A0A316VML6_9BASI|nr:alpha/beta-hydrolase [Meira miltonrushii]PWN38550.1 alpha/beta-hydrolase [Meira miltonrushii]
MAKHKDHTEPGKGESERQDITTVAGANRAALHKQGLYKPKGWITHGLTSLMQLPNATPLAVLRWTTPEGPMPHILNLPSRDEGRHIKIYVWIPPPGSGSFTGTRRPCLVDFHGGGFTMGGPLEQAPWCAALARAGIIAISVHYRLGPTWEFPAALLDAEDVINAILDVEGNTEPGKFIRREVLRCSKGRTEFDESKVGISGFSSGGNIALNMLLSIPAHLNTSKADEGGNDGDWPSPFLNAQSPLRTIPALLFFPSLDARQAPFDRKRPEGMAPQGEVSKWIGKTLLNAYLPQEFVSHLRATMKHATLDCMHPATRALLILPQIDTLSEQSEVWQDSMGHVRVHRIEKMSHGFTTFPDSFIDEKTRAAKKLVMDQALLYVIEMFKSS